MPHLIRTLKLPECPIALLSIEAPQCPPQFCAIKGTR
jgi:hypothetical protein